MSNLNSWLVCSSEVISSREVGEDENEDEVRNSGICNVVKCVVICDASKSSCCFFHWLHFEH